MGISDFLKEIAGVGKHYPIATLGAVFGSILASLHFNGAEHDPLNITLYVGLATLVLSGVLQIVVSLRNHYRRDTVYCLNIDHTLAPAEPVLRGYIAKNYFQFLALRLGASEAGMEVYARSETGGVAFAKRVDVYNVMKKTADTCSASLGDILRDEGKSTSANVLRLAFDVHPGGAFFFGDCNLEKGALFVFGYTNYQSNVDDCSDALGGIIDNLRKLPDFGGLPPIVRIKEKDPE